MTRMLYTVENMKLNTKKHILRMIIALTMYALGVCGFVHFYTAEGPHKSPWLVLLPLLPIVFLAYCSIRYVAELDEMKRKIVTEAMAFSGLATGYTCFSYMFLRDVGAPEFHGEWAIYMMFIYYWIGLFFSWRRYR